MRANAERTSNGPMPSGAMSTRSRSRARLRLGGDRCRRTSSKSWPSARSALRGTVDLARRRPGTEGARLRRKSEQEEGGGEARRRTDDETEPQRRRVRAAARVPSSASASPPLAHALRLAARALGTNQASRDAPLDQRLESFPMNRRMHFTFDRCGLTTESTRESVAARRQMAVQDGSARERA